MSRKYYTKKKCKELAEEWCSDIKQTSLEDFIYEHLNQAFEKGVSLENEKKQVNGLNVLYEIRNAVGDPHCKLMQDQLVDKIKDLVEDSKHVIQLTKRMEEFHGSYKKLKEVDKSNLKDWPADIQKLENGAYQNNCCICNKTYIGPKSSYVCWSCKNNIEEK